MKNLLIFLGCMIMSCLLFLSPIIATLSIILKWDFSIRIISFLIFIGELIGVMSGMYGSYSEN